MRRKCTSHMASHSYKMNDVETMFWGGYRSMCTAKMIFGPYQWDSSHMGRELISHAMSLHPWSMPSISVVNTFMINNISEKQLKEHRWKECSKLI